MKILYVGRNDGTSGHRAAAMSRLGHEVTVLDPFTFAPSNRVVSQWNRRTGFLGIAGIVRRRMAPGLDRASFDLAWVDHGAIISAALVRDLKARIPLVIGYNVDDPFGTRDARFWRGFLKAVPYYDLLAVVRTPNIAEAYSFGARRVMHVYRSADEVAHAPRQLTPAELARWHSEIAFVGTGFPERGPFLAELVRLGVPLTIYGNRYNRLPQWATLRPHWRSANAESGEGYANAILAAKVCLGMLSKGNRDLHTTRSMEIPSLGGVFCAERTEEHLALYRENEEAVFWSSPEECAERCFALLADEPWRRSIAVRGHQRYLQNGWTNMQAIQSILNAATGMPEPGAAEAVFQAARNKQFGVHS